MDPTGYIRCKISANVTLAENPLWEALDSNQDIMLCLTSLTIKDLLIDFQSGTLPLSYKSPKDSVNKPFGGLERDRTAGFLNR